MKVYYREGHVKEFDWLDRADSICRFETIEPWTTPEGKERMVVREFLLDDRVDGHHRFVEVWAGIEFPLKCAHAEASLQDAVAEKESGK